MLQILQQEDLEYDKNSYVHAKDLFEIPEVQGVVIRIVDQEPIYVDRHSTLFTQLVGLQPMKYAVCLHRGAQIKIVYAQLFGANKIDDDWAIDVKWLDDKISESLTYNKTGRRDENV